MVAVLPQNYKGRRKADKERDEKRARSQKHKKSSKRPRSQSRSCSKDHKKARTHDRRRKSRSHSKSRTRTHFRSRSRSSCRQEKPQRRHYHEYSLKHFTFKNQQDSYRWTKRKFLKSNQRSCTFLWAWNMVFYSSKTGGCSRVFGVQIKRWP